MYIMLCVCVYTFTSFGRQMSEFSPSPFEQLFSQKNLQIFTDYLLDNTQLFSNLRNDSVVSQSKRIIHLSAEDICREYI